VNPLDVEEIVWDIACQNRLMEQNPDYELKKMALPAGKNDRRRIMVRALRRCYLRFSNKECVGGMTSLTLSYRF